MELVDSSSHSARVCGVRVLGAWASVRYRHTPAKIIPEKSTSDELYAVPAMSDSPVEASLDRTPIIGHDLHQQSHPPKFPSSLRGENDEDPRK